MARTCPLCGDAAKRTRKLYGSPVCAGCHGAFARRRQVAYFVDWALWIPVMFLAVTTLAGAAAAAGMDQATFDVTLVLAQWVALPLLFICKDGFRGRSPGKALMGVQVVDRERLAPIGVAGSLKRNLPLMIPIMPPVIAFLLMKGDRPGDGWAGTRVIWRRHAQHPVFTGAAACATCGNDRAAGASGACAGCSDAALAGDRGRTPLPAGMRRAA